MKMDTAWRIVTLSLLSLLVAANFYVFSRITVDDAYITWRYGQNLIESGIWGYNPTSFDLTQAYTNPIYAILSIIPALLRIDVVLFFKLFSLATLLLPLTLIYRAGADKTRFAQLYLLFLALPATMIHIFAGLETFLFIILLGGLFVALIESRFWLANALACALLFVRPEIWILIGLLPAYFFFTPALGSKFRSALTSFALVGGSFALYALFHYWYFGYVLPNTFYIKSAQALNINVAIYFAAYLAPLFGLLFTHHRRIAAFALLVYLPIVYCYAASNLQMNYAGRFAFHIWGGVFWLLAYLIIKPIPGRKLLGKTVTFWCVLGLLAITALFAKYNNHPIAMREIAGWTPRALELRPALGKTIHAIKDRYDIERMATSDAGTLPYHAQLVSLDPIGLGSSLVAHQGLTYDVAEQYHPDLAILMLTFGELRIPGEVILKKWLLANGRKPLCKLVLRSDRALEIYTREDIPELRKLCTEITNRRDIGGAAYFMHHVKIAPWYYWQSQHPPHELTGQGAP